MEFQVLLWNVSLFFTPSPSSQFKPFVGIPHKLYTNILQNQIEKKRVIVCT